MEAGNCLLYHAAGHVEIAYNRINDLRQSREFCDVTLLVGIYKIQAHRLILAACSPYFKNLFKEAPSHEIQNGEFFIPYLDGQSVDKIVDYFYTSVISIGDDLAWDLLKAAKMLKIPAILNICMVYLKSTLSCQNCLSRRKTSVHYGLDRLTADCDQYILAKSAQVVKDTSFLDLEFADLMNIMNGLKLAEAQMRPGFANWLYHRHSDRQKYIATILHKYPAFRAALNFNVTEIDEKQTVADLHTVNSCPNCNKALSTAETLAHHIKDCQYRGDTITHDVRTAERIPFPEERNTDQGRQPSVFHQALLIDNQEDGRISCDAARYTPTQLVSSIEYGPDRCRHGPGPARRVGRNLHRCDICCKTFLSLEVLQRHKRTHHGERRPYRPYLQRFKGSDSLAENVTSHTGERGFRCQPRKQNTRLRQLLTHKGRTQSNQANCGTKMSKAEATSASSIAPERIVHLDSNLHIKVENDIICQDNPGLSMEPDISSEVYHPQNMAESCSDTNISKHSSSSSSHGLCMKGSPVKIGNIASNAEIHTPFIKIESCDEASPGHLDIVLDSALVSDNNPPQGAFFLDEQYRTAPSNDHHTNSSSKNEYIFISEYQSLIDQGSSISDHDIFTDQGGINSRQLHNQSGILIPNESSFMENSEEFSLKHLEQMGSHLEQMGSLVAENTTCPICGKCFNRPRYLDMHMSVHTGERPFQCPMCERAFRVKGNLQQHMRCHTGERPFKCNLCNSRFSRSTHLRTHMKTHTGDKAFGCHMTRH